MHRLLFSAETLYPELHPHSKEPTVFSHTCSHGLATHSSTSIYYGESRKEVDYMATLDIVCFLPSHEKPSALS